MLILKGNTDELHLEGRSCPGLAFDLEENAVSCGCWQPAAAKINAKITVFKSQAFLND